MIDQGIINHVGLVLDASLSMEYLAGDVIKVVDGLIETLATRSREMNQETRITVYKFNTKTECLFYDKDVLRLPSLKNMYRVGGNTALIDATLRAIGDMEQTATLYGDHAFLLYVLTDGQENSSSTGPRGLKTKLDSLSDRWTVAAMVPDTEGIRQATYFGFLPDNIAQWDTTVEGVAQVGETIRRTTESFMQARSAGVRSSKSLFQLDVSKLTTEGLKRVSPYDYNFSDKVSANGPLVISEFVRWKMNKTYEVGTVYYELTKPEEIQPHKQICVYDKRSGALFRGPEVRKMLGIPPVTTKVHPAEHPLYKLYVQSTSVNRKLVPGTQVLWINPRSYW